MMQRAAVRDQRGIGKAKKWLRQVASPCSGCVASSLRYRNRKRKNTDVIYRRIAFDNSARVVDVALISRTTLSFRMLSDLCFVG
jgi:hypothetical protein